MSTKDCEIKIPVNLPLITCEKCNMEFILMSPVGNEGDYWAVGDRRIYCPFCGEFTRKD